MEEPLDRLPDEDIQSVDITRVPFFRSASGYGSRIPTQYRIRVGNRWHRVYAICYSNAASHYVNRNGGRQFLMAVTETRLEDAMDAKFNRTRSTM